MQQTTVHLNMFTWYMFTQLTQHNDQHLLHTTFILCISTCGTLTQQLFGKTKWKN